MTALLNWRVWAGLIFAIGLAVSHFTVYRSGKASVRAEWTAEKLAQSEAARQREKAMNVANQGVDRAYQIKERRRAADAVVVAGRLRDLESALAAATDTTAPGSSDAPFAGIASECARKLVLMDDYASKLAGTASALQGYARSVCVVQ